MLPRLPLDDTHRARRRKARRGVFNLVPNHVPAYNHRGLVASKRAIATILLSWARQRQPELCTPQTCAPMSHGQRVRSRHDDKTRAQVAPLLVCKESEGQRQPLRQNGRSLVRSFLHDPKCRRRVGGDGQRINKSLRSYPLHSPLRAIGSLNDRVIVGHFD